MFSFPPNLVAFIETWMMVIISCSSEQVFTAYYKCSNFNAIQSHCLLGNGLKIAFVYCVVTVCLQKVHLFRSLKALKAAPAISHWLTLYEKQVEKHIFFFLQLFMDLNFLLSMSPCSCTYTNLEKIGYLQNQKCHPRPLVMRCAVCLEKTNFFAHFV